LERFLHDEIQPRPMRPSQVKRMDPKLYLLFAIFSIIAAGASHENLREYARKLGFSRLRKGGLPRQA
jgi:hypothetical protein